MSKPTRLMLSGWPPNVVVSAYTVDGLEEVQRRVADLRTRNLPDDQFRAEARAIMDHQKAHDEPLIEAYVREYGIPGFDDPLPDDGAPKPASLH